ncbi:hypothetical protein [Chitinophaga ginsengisoli]|uniref:Uncharacterized protein n=1 Tax=Chitinophaga ginsengisoli TaxID=363837 RepID=A0A2P8GCT0_9BACT|nr:hypothetical protein [Chitinophaga ginsengisoli]PSL31784.1 hypothetical protein CLV42_10478 [Chitinophaga ginsengisoli]
MKNFFSVLCVILLFIWGCSVPGSTQRYRSQLDSESAGNKPIPDAFNPSDGILLIEDWADQDRSVVKNSVYVSYQTDDYVNNFVTRNKKRMIAYLKENYPSKYEFAAQSEIYGSKAKYSNKTVYQYALVISLVKRSQRMETQFFSGNEGSTHHQPIFRYYIYDRLNNKTYAALGYGASTIMLAFKGAIKRINRKR